MYHDYKRCQGITEDVIEQKKGAIVGVLEAMPAKWYFGLLEQAGIPSTTRGPDFDVAELGSAAHAMIRGTQVIVPAAALAAARSVLTAAGFGGASSEPELPDDSAEKRPSPDAS